MGIQTQINDELAELNAVEAALDADYRAKKKVINLRQRALAAALLKITQDMEDVVALLKDDGQ